MTEPTTNRVRLGKLAHNLALDSDGNLSSRQLDISIADLIKRCMPKSTGNDSSQFTQLQMINESLCVIKFILVAQTAETAEEVQEAVQQLDKFSFELQRKAVGTSGLDVESLDEVLNRSREILALSAEVYPDGGS